MANSIIGNGSNTVTMDNLSVKADLTINIAPVGNGAVGTPVLINTGSWQPLPTASLADVGGYWLDNVAGPGTVQFIIAPASASGLVAASTLKPSNYTWNHWTGSIVIYGKALDSGSWVNLIEWSA